MNYLSICNHQSVKRRAIPELLYDEFRDTVLERMLNHPERHCVNYFGAAEPGGIRLFCCIADDVRHQVDVFSCKTSGQEKLLSLTPILPALERFEREIFENFGIFFSEHPWLKPVRYPFSRADQSVRMTDYPFFSIQSESLHEVGVGPVHAGIIEPGHFRFICNGEQILHLEIQLGYQHRGIESLFLTRTRLPERVTLAEGIAGDTVVGHTTAFAAVWESLCQSVPSDDILFARTLALELERVAIHTGDLSAVCTDIAYQLGSAVLGRLRTPIVNFMQEWGGNRLSKGLIRPGRNPFPFTCDLAERLLQVLDEYEPDFKEINQHLFRLPSALSRFERTGVVSFEEVSSMGAVGMTARMSGLNRDIRASHPYGYYPLLEHVPIIKHHGDVYSRVQIRRQEVMQSLGYIRFLVQNMPEIRSPFSWDEPLQPDLFGLSLIEGWRGEICHCALTDGNGNLISYKIKDPSFHNWTALALAVRNNEISDFPICNKSFNLSYSGHDL